MSLELLKVLHLISLVFWIGPGFGAYWILWKMGRSLADRDRLQLEKYYEQTLRVEHFFLILVLLSGVGMLSIMGWDMARLPWLKTKLFLVGGIVLIEILDIYLAHFLFRRLVGSGAGISEAVWKRALRIRNQFYAVTLPLMAIWVLGAFYLAVVKVI